MRVALTTNVLKIPPTYFVVNHAEQLADRHQFEVFALMADVRDQSVTVPVSDFAAFRSLDPARRIYLAPFAGTAMARGVKAFKPDLVHQHFATWSGPAISAAHSLGRPLVTTLHGYDVRVMAGTARTPMQAWHRRNVRAIQAKSARVLSVSKYLADEAIAAGFDSHRLEVHYQGVDTGYFTPSENAGWGVGVPIVSFVGALSEHKGPLDLVASSIAIVAEHDHRLQIVGSGPLEHEIRDMARGYPHIELLGKISKEEVRATLRRSWTTALPSKESKGGKEAAGLVLLEAQACGAPVIAYDSGGTAEMLDQETTGLLVPEGDKSKLKNAIREVLGLSVEERTRMGQAARGFVENERSLAQSSLELERHYAEVS